MFRSHQLSLGLMMTAAVVAGGLIGFPVGAELHDMTAAADYGHLPTQEPLWQDLASKGTLRPTTSTTFSDTGDGVVLRSRFKKLPVSSGATGGAHLVIPSEIEAQVAGHKITIEANISIKPSSRADLHQFALAYSTAAVGNSGWRKFDAKPGRRSYRFSYVVPETKANKQRGKDFFGVISDVTGNGRSIVLHEARLYKVD